MIRYPGSKAKIADRIMSRFPSAVMDRMFQSAQMEYREPFFGGGAVGFAVMERLPSHCRVWINDRDYGLAALWKSVRDDHRGLIKEIQRFTPTVDSFYKFKEDDGKVDAHPTIVGFQKLALHQVSFSGNGAMAGGPIGGREQRSEFNVDCRWNATRLCLDVARLHALMSNFDQPPNVTSGDFDRLIVDAPKHAFIYADPPYYKAGPQLYKYSLNDSDHARLSDALRACSAEWVLSYDDHEFIRSAYGWARISSVDITYTTAVAQGRRRKNSELIITPPSARGTLTP